MAVHRITRESLANVARHAAGNSVEVRADIVDGEVRLIVADQGRAASPPDPHAATSA